MAEYAFDVTAQEWRDDPYYIGSSQPVHKIEVVASTEKEARQEAVRVLGPAHRHYYWRMWVKQGRDIRLIASE